MSFLSSWVFLFCILTAEDGTESSVRNYQHPLHNDPEEHSFHLLRGWILNSRLLNYFWRLGTDVLVFLYTKYKAPSSSLKLLTLYQPTRCRIPVTLLWEPQISQSMTFPSLCSNLIPITMYTQCPLGHIQHHINPVHSRKLYCIKKYFDSILISLISMSHTLPQKILTKIQGICYVLCM